MSNFLETFSIVRTITGILIIIERYCAFQLLVYLHSLYRKQDHFIGQCSLIRTLQIFVHRLRNISTFAFYFNKYYNIRYH